MIVEELRVGNTVERLFKAFGIEYPYWAESKITPDDMVGFSQHSNCFRPIKLHPERLMKMGYYKVARESGGFKYIFNYTGVHYIELHDMNTTGFLCNKTFYSMEYLHQLENLHFALMYKEHPIGLPTKFKPL